MRMIGMAAALLMTNSLSAQNAEGGRAGECAVLERSLEMDLAQSAAPPTVSEEATVLLWNGYSCDRSSRSVRALPWLSGLPCRGGHDPSQAFQFQYRHLWIE
jgi:hypothetical protein